MLAARPRPRLAQALRRALRPPPAPRVHAPPLPHRRGVAAPPTDHGPDVGRVAPGRRRSSFARKHFERRLVPFSMREVYDVVANVDEYCEFVPWCTASKVTNRIHDGLVVADLSVGFRVLSDKYTSVVTLEPMRAVSVDVPNSNLFEYLITDWNFEKATDPRATDLSFYVEFAFRNPLYQRVTDLFFEEVVKQMVGAFEKRCHTKYRFTDRRAGFLHRW